MKKRKSYRKLVTPYGDFEWKYGGRGIFVRKDGGSWVSVCVRQLDGREFHVFEKGQWKKTRDGMIQPGQVRAWLDREENRNSL